MVSIKSTAEIAKMRTSGQILSEALALAKSAIRDGVTTKELEVIIADFLAGKGAEASFKNFRGYPASACISVNEEVVHGIPGPRKIKDGDIVSVDVGVRYKGMYTDAAFTKIVGTVDESVEKLVRVTKDSLIAAIDIIKPGKTLGDIGAIVSEIATTNNLAVIRDLVGHGVGYRVHEDPQIPNFGEAGQGLKLQEGMTLALEPMLALGKYDVRSLEDGWTFVTTDGEPAAHFEHTVAVTKDSAEILTE